MALREGSSCADCHTLHRADDDPRPLEDWREVDDAVTARQVHRRFVLAVLVLVAAVVGVDEVDVIDAPAELRDELDLTALQHLALPRVSGGIHNGQRGMRAGWEMKSAACSRGVRRVSPSSGS